MPLHFPDKEDYDRIRENDKFDIIGLNEFSAGKKIIITIHHSNGKHETIHANHSYNESQIEWFRAGSALNLIRITEKKD